MGSVLPYVFLLCRHLSIYFDIVVKQTFYHFSCFFFLFFSSESWNHPVINTSLQGLKDFFRRWNQFKFFKNYFMKQKIENAAIPFSSNTLHCLFFFPPQFLGTRGETTATATFHPFKAHILPLLALELWEKAQCYSGSTSHVAFFKLHLNMDTHKTHFFSFFFFLPTT